MWGQMLCILSKQGIIVIIHRIFPWPSKGGSYPKSKPGHAHGLHSHAHIILRARLERALLLLHMPCKLLLLHRHHRHGHEFSKKLLLLMMMMLLLVLLLLLLLLLGWLSLLLRLLLGHVRRPGGLASLAILLAVLLVISSDQTNRAGGRGAVHVEGIASVSGVRVPFPVAVATAVVFLSVVRVSAV